MTRSSGTLPPLIPRPRSMRRRTGALDIGSVGRLSVSAQAALPVARRFRDDLLAWTGMTLPEPEAAEDAHDLPCGVVRVELTSAAESDAGTEPSAEAHVVSVDERGLRVASGTLHGLYRGLTSVVQIIATAGPVVPALEIEDDGRFTWRGLSLDVARSFAPTAELERIIDVLALYKIGILHLHLSDNEGWRLAIDHRPELTPADPDGTASFYTAEEFARLTAYAAERFVTIVPELDLPGHLGAALRAYPSLNREAAGGLDSPFPRAHLDPASSDAAAFVDDVVDALAAASGPVIHIGGDEPFGMDEEAYTAFVDRAVVRARSLGKTVIGWQETSRAAIGPAEIVQHWIDIADDADEGGSATPPALPDDVVAALSAAFASAVDDDERIASAQSRVVMSPTRHAYLDRPHADGSLDPEQHGRRAGLGLPYYPPTPLSDYLEWDPASIRPTIPAAQIIGVEGALWTETATTPTARAELLLPRLPAIAEVAWSTGPSVWDEFRERLAHHGALWDRRALPWYRSDAVAWSPSLPSRTSATR